MVQMSIPDATSSRTEVLAWQQHMARSRPALASGWLPRIALAILGIALALTNAALYARDGYTDALGLSAVLSLGGFLLAFLLVRLREKKIEAETALVENQLRFDMAFAGARCGI
jgi:two-component system cell cycle sensor histidine kinase PleC